MKKYLITFYHNYNRVCSCIKEGKSQNDAELNAEYSLICKYPNVIYDTYECHELLDS